jgi:D-alanyl-lipoteichoic acid acyltransferase DltB (MBOAT superfamily)
VIFSNLEFFVFFAAFVPLYLATMRHLRAQNVLILAASWLFYGWWDVRFLSLIAASTCLDYVTGLALAGRPVGPRTFAAPALALFGLAGGLLAAAVPGAPLILALTTAFFAGLAALHLLAARLAPARRIRLLFWAAIATNLGILGTFKYLGFFADSFAELAGLFGWEPDVVTLSLVLPVGISFYTFQSMSYTIDVRRGQVEPTTDFVQFAAYVSFFPQLVAGPIERASRLLPQFAVRRVLSRERLQEGAMLFLWGFYKKAVVADNLAPLADRLFADPAAAAPGELLVGVLAFSFQIYCDFSGYSDMARGLARGLGFDLMVNFDMPYFARTPSEFWQRWHVSLSSWLRDYLYIPLGGNRGGRLATVRNLMLTMLIGGLWHGAAWTFVAWGAFHGAILVLYRALGVDSALARRTPDQPAGLLLHVAAALVMFGLAVISWVFFRAESFADAFLILGRMGELRPVPVWDRLLFHAGPLLAIELWTRLSGRSLPWERRPLFLRANVALFALCAALFLAAAEGQAFIYFDF